MAYTAPILAVAVLALLQVPGIQQGGDSLSGLIVGQVVDAESGSPIRGAIVALSGPSPAGGAAHPRILTSHDGRFVYRGLRRGRYNISSYKPGYTDGAYGRTRPAGPSVPLVLTDGQRTDEPIVRMWRQAAISGTVVDEAGERMIGVRVQAYRRTVVSGRRRYLPSGSATTDDRGIYRIGTLIPGDYIVGAAARQVVVPLSANRDVLALAPPSQAIRAQSSGMAGSGVDMLRISGGGLVLGGGMPTPPPARDGVLLVYPPTFHPNAPSGDAATIIPVRAGAEFVSADLQLAPLPTVSMSGYVGGPDGPVTMTPLRLLPASTAEITFDADATTTMTDRSGRFTFPAVPSGQYSLRLVRGSTPVARLPGAPNTVVWVDLPVSVGTEHIENLMVEAQPGVKIGGRVEFEGSRQSNPSPSRVVVSIEPADLSSAPGGSRSVSVRVNRFGEFTSQPLPGGRYYVRIPNSPGGWMFKSATADGRDVVDTPINVTTDVPNIVVTFTDRWSGLNGHVQNREGPDAAAAVLVFPTDTDTWGSSGGNPRRVRSIRTGKAGDYSVNLPPGDYYVIAVPDAQLADWQDPAFLDAASRAAMRVTISEGERRRLDLRTRALQ